ncbi:MAG: hypothetical protein H7Y88_10285, partial [Phycisphaerales bacterium]|nr:hypothetical protein [Phycisphaerales bacterium]
MHKPKLAIAVLALASGGFAASADVSVVITFGFTDLNASYNQGTGLFSARAVDTPELRSDGNVSRLITPVGTPAHFAAGFVSGIDPADFMLSLAVTNISALTADGNGAFLITDPQGDTIGGQVSGLFVRGNSGNTFFNGDLLNVTLANTSGDGMFNGATSGAWSMNLGAGPFSGALVQLFTRPSSVGFFTQDFTGIADLASGDIVPAPGAA